MGWIAAIIMGFIAAVALATIWRLNRRRVQHLRRDHQAKVQKISDEHRQRLDRLDRDFKRQMATAHHPLARDLLPALDSLDQAMEYADAGSVDEGHHSPTSAAQGDGEREEIVAGLAMARRAINDALARHGIDLIDPTPGDPFDPTCHEAIARNDSGTYPPSTITALLRPGYRDDDRILRAALVEVAVGPDQAPSSLDSPRDASDVEPDGLSSVASESGETSESVEASPDASEAADDEPKRR